MLVDSHCHLTDPRFDADRPLVLARAREAGVERILTIASNRMDSERVAAFTSEVSWKDGEIPGLWGSAGVHPHEAEEARPGDLDTIRTLARETPRIVAVGETGLDFFYDNSPRETQESLFRGHMAMAEELGLPIIVHSRSADERTGAVLQEWGSRVQGVLHCFNGGRELLETALDLGWMISLTGIITFKNYRDQELVRSIPRNRVMVETDAPYLAPVPHRGRRNEPAFVADVAEALAAIRGEPSGEVRAYTSENAIRFFGMNP